MSDSRGIEEVGAIFDENLHQNQQNKARNNSHGDLFPDGAAPNPSGQLPDHRRRLSPPIPHSCSSLETERRERTGELKKE